ncbi:4-hydroxythreonine-4-phosphate dehydrogenase PdxA [Hydrogenophaga crassostreae]|uniref:4-hydroxythreonine-4-phosphate dehydrogenase PdxA n=1 Tax=Hydrogenophaga crassostreae TaxID=1763535 RepID=A0A163CCM0_9BURK|nr:4-hydroxythreonine-4-phosphate dehydrogenase PdxA [Hydrogenophaga crassostreae]AOW12286.1 4-hydroxythreonine-4-phosphate dehydrogenase PdxA [Hydrogenophaga crassostreae]OAD41236.1 4-hydroxythreonine-4-phosphate dehydrogenase PdxA [Hydrogenophaga crassostreae]
MPNPLNRLPMVLTMGDPAGIGPEIIAGAMIEHPDLLAKEVVVAGDVRVLRRAGELVAKERGLALPEWLELTGLDSWQPQVGRLAVVQACEPVRDLQMGQVSASSGLAAAQCIEWAANRALQGMASAVVTAPIHKEALSAAGVHHPGHTEFFQALAAEHLGVKVDSLPVRMMLSCPGLCTVLVSIHVSLREAIAAVTSAQVLQTLRLTVDHFQRCGHPRVRIAVAGLNPHAGEGGLFGREEIDAIAPAVQAAQADGVQVVGPVAPDTVFMRARRGEFDVVIAMYHDQGLIPVKLLGLDEGVNTTIGLPFVRTSPDHGTAFDLAGTGRANPASLWAAIEAARGMSLQV